MSEATPTPAIRDGSAHTGSLVALAVMAAVFLAGLVVAGPLAPEALDLERPIVRWLAEHRTETLTFVMKRATHLGDPAVVSLALASAAVLAYFVLRSARWPVFFAGALAGALLLARFMKPLVGRPRPDLDALHIVGNKAFPSGHATAAAACFGALAFLGIRLWRNGRRGWVWGAAAAVALLVGFTRVYLGVHWPSDVIGGLFLGFGWTVLVARAAGIKAQPDG
jgi:membrane-associated phospholipid phosphatase